MVAETNTIGPLILVEGTIRITSPKLVIGVKVVATTRIFAGTKSAVFLAQIATTIKILTPKLVRTTNEG